MRVSWEVGGGAPPPPFTGGGWRGRGGDPDSMLLMRSTLAALVQTVKMNCLTPCVFILSGYDHFLALIMTAPPRQVCGMAWL